MSLIRFLSFICGVFVATVAGAQPSKRVLDEVVSTYVASARIVCNSINPSLEATYCKDGQCIDYVFGSDVSKLSAACSVVVGSPNATNCTVEPIAPRFYDGCSFAFDPSVYCFDHDTQEWGSCPNTVASKVYIAYWDELSHEYQYTLYRRIRYGIASIDALPAFASFDTPIPGVNGQLSVPVSFSATIDLSQLHVSVAVLGGKIIGSSTAAATSLSPQLVFDSYFNAIVFKGTHSVFVATRSFTNATISIRYRGAIVLSRSLPVSQYPQVYRNTAGRYCSPTGGVLAYDNCNLWSCDCDKTSSPYVISFKTKTNVCGSMAAYVVPLNTNGMVSSGHRFCPGHQVPAVFMSNGPPSVTTMSPTNSFSECAVCM